MSRAHPADAVYDRALVWDQHACLPLRPDASIAPLRRFREHGVDVVSVNVGFDAVPWKHAMAVLSSFRAQVLEDPGTFALVGTAREARAAAATGRLGVVFDLEGTEALDGRLSMVETYHRLGVRTMSTAYNLDNRAGGGCHGDPQQGLTAFGREVVAEMNRVGMLVDATHCSRRTTMDLFEHSTAPVVFSHSVPSGVKPHPRNVDDEQLRACAATGGVVGINGVGIFLGDNAAETSDLLRAVEYAVELIGPEHVGLGLDHVFDQAELDRFIADNPAMFPADGGYDDLAAGPLAFAGPHQLRELARLLAERGFPDAAIRGILGENFLRVADAAWRPAAEPDAGTAPLVAP